MKSENTSFEGLHPISGPRYARLYGGVPRFTFLSSFVYFSIAISPVFYHPLAPREQASRRCGAQGGAPFRAPPRLAHWPRLGEPGRRPRAFGVLRGNYTYPASPTRFVFIR